MITFFKKTSNFIQKRVKLTFTIFIISTFCISNISGQINIDTLKYQKTGELIIYKFGSSIAHERPTNKLVINEKKGLNMIYRKDGSLYQKGSFKYGEDSLLVKDGMFQYYYSNEKIRDIGTYKDGERIGIWKHFDQNGTLIYEQNYTSLVRTYYYPDNTILAIGKMKQETETNEFLFFDLAEHEGFWVFRDVNGDCNCAGEVTSSLKHGKWSYYHNKKDRKVKRKFYRRYVANYKYTFQESCEWQ